MNSYQTPEEVAAWHLPTKPYMAVVSADFEKMEPAAMYELARKLINSNAMWIAAHGNKGTLFDDAVDEEFVDRNIRENASYPLVMSTWHDDETLADVQRFLQSVTPHEDWGKLDDWEIIVIGIE